MDCQVRNLFLKSACGLAGTDSGAVTVCVGTDSGAATLNSSAEFCTHMRFMLSFSLRLPRRVRKEELKTRWLGSLAEKIEGRANCTSRAQWLKQELVFGGFNIFIWGQRAKRLWSGGGIPPVSCSARFEIERNVYSYRLNRCIFHGTANWAQFCQNLRISGGLGPKPLFVRHCMSELLNPPVPFLWEQRLVKRPNIMVIL
jgi:hypothetical protein